MAAASVLVVCSVCGWVYDPAQGDPDHGIPPGTAWADVPADWVCPVCGAPPSAFGPVEAAPTADAAPARGDAALPVVILGSGLAGVGLARALRAAAPDLPLTLVTADGGEVYAKPMLSNALAQGMTADDLVQQPGEALAAALGIALHTRRRAVGLDRAARAVVLDSGARLPYGRLVLALGADPRVFPVPGDSHPGVETVNDLDGYRRWRARLAAGGGCRDARVLLIGAGLIGCEFANDLASAGARVTVVDPAPWPLARLVPREVGEALGAALADQGVVMHLGRTVVAYDDDATAEGGRVAVLDDGQRLPVAHVLSAVGLAPRTALAAEAGLAVRAGIVVDALLQTDDPAIFALGDCAETPAGVLPYVAPLLTQVRCLAATLTGRPTPLTLPALPVVVKTPALPLVVCPPPAGVEGSWQPLPPEATEATEAAEGDGTGDDATAAQDAGYAMAFVTPTGERRGFALTGAATERHRRLAATVPALLGGPDGGTAEGAGTDDGARVCTVCGWVYDPAIGDPGAGVSPGTAWEAVAEGWVCPICGADKEAFAPIDEDAARP